MTDLLSLDLTQVPFSRAGSYLALSLRDPDESRPWEQRPGDALFLRTVRGDRETDRAFRLEPVTPEGLLSFRVEAAPCQVRLQTQDGMIELCLSEENGLCMRGAGKLGLRLTLVHVGAYGSMQPYDRAGRWLVNAWPARMSYLLTPVTGRLCVDAPAGVLHTVRAVAEFWPGAHQAGFEALLEECQPERPHTPPAPAFAAQSAAADAAWQTFLSAQPPVPDALQNTAALMAYVQWSALVAPEGHLGRPAMLMSKNHMTSVWSWDHCFNALALMSHAPELAWHQFCLPFDHQDRAGALPDAVNDKALWRNFTKPPIHGWTLRGLQERDRSGYLTNDRLQEIYEPLSRWTRWWPAFRDHDGDGVPQYDHGNDSGWDNCTAFDVGFPLEGPDLSAYLVMQMDVLADLARRLDCPAEAAGWQTEADALLERLMTHSWREGRFLAPRSETHTTTPAEQGDSLLPFLPLALGPRLPEVARRPLIDGLLAPGRFVTDFGLATEAVSSARHESDGYWRGPIWAPPVLLIADGLRRLGENAAARDIAERFCRAVVRSGSAENFDARTGAGLRDRAYTWTASVFLVLAREYLNDDTSLT